MMKLQRPEPETRDLDQVLALAKRARSTVGFLPDSAFVDRASQGTLVTSIENNVLLGYVLYDLPRDEVRIVQLVVDSEMRGRGIARRLVEEIAESHSERRGVVLHCRNDFPAHHMWPKLGFVPVGERPGRSFEGKPLTRWYRPFGQPDLFSLLEETDARPIALLDSCVFFDLVSSRPSVLAKQLRSDWIGEHVRLAVGDQVLVEVSNHQSPEMRRKERTAAEPFRLSSVPPEAWRREYDGLLARHSDAPAKDRSDLTHVAQAIAAGAGWLITSDRTFLRRYAATAKLEGVSLVSPAAFLRAVDELARSDRYQPVELAGTQVLRREVGALALAGLSERFVNHGDGESIGALRRETEITASRPNAVRLEVIEVANQPRGLLASEMTSSSLVAPLVRVTAGKAESTLGRQILGLLRDRAVRQEISEVVITDRYPSAAVRRSLRDEGFSIGDDGATFVANPLRGHGSLESLSRKAKRSGAPAKARGLFKRGALVARAASAERWFAPYRVIGAAIPNFFVPIRHAYAMALFDVGLAEGQLFPRDWNLGLRRELVYFRSPRATPRGFSAPARLLWYVSGTEPGAGNIRAVSHLREVVVDNFKRVFRRFEQLGVFDLDMARAAADSHSRVMALRFSHTQLLSDPIPLTQYRAAIAGDPQAQVPLQSPQPVPEHVFASLIGARHE
jgi:ribosomal protein S18 acetylase RimI-like enzyme